ncbi:hypothetical protein R1sor_020760 [Riccia sorocarpa]|uniref:SPIN-DOC-like zinc-finger domain-containing protein n=1 Tax=Riccia sorocarpa TaxID=122646 RepID=A0ABD3GH77_9MARC
MSKTTTEIWRDQVERLIKWTEKYKKTDHRWRRINEEETREKQLFVVEGDVNREPCYSWIYRVRCILCSNKFELVPQKRNLEHNLRRHLCSEKHRERIDVDPSLKGGIRTGDKGRPKRSDPRDTKRQRSIETFFGSNRHPTTTSESLTTSSSQFTHPV